MVAHGIFSQYIFKIPQRRVVHGTKELKVLVSNRRRHGVPVGGGKVATASPTFLIAACSREHALIPSPVVAWSEGIFATASALSGDVTGRGASPYLR